MKRFLRVMTGVLGTVATCGISASALAVSYNVVPTPDIEASNSYFSRGYGSFCASGGATKARFGLREWNPTDYPSGISYIAIYATGDFSASDCVVRRHLPTGSGYITSFSGAVDYSTFWYITRTSSIANASGYFFPHVECELDAGDCINGAVWY